ncbi:hypothetical protein J5N97_028651 [Dioscorea zingiberensis]|uniref:Hexosyltransferase n=1 Tax=Dioscorea zingiberensis TaxID=325984 RepID=A0A9D5H515_9LILI|nr:hypothetical protein J5N97_028651 [Dioscorea zingiberensis]
MRRRAPGRPSRKRFSDWIWWLLGFFLFIGLVLFIVHHRHESPFEPPVKDMSTEFEDANQESVNFTQELMSSTSFARQLIDQMTLAKAYVIIAKDRSNAQLAWELSSQIRKCQRLLSQAAVRGKSVTLEEAHPVVSHLSELIYKARDYHYDISTTIVTLKKHSQALEERAIAATVQSAEFGQLAVEAMPKYLHCLNIKLTMDWFEDPKLEKLAEEHRTSLRLADINLYHFCIFSDNVLATSVVINSTISNCDHPQQLMFHVVTDAVNYHAMKTWFMRNNFQGCTIDIQNINEFSWMNASYSPMVKHLLNEETRAHYFNGGAAGENRGTKFRNSKSVSLLNHLRFYIPEVYPYLEKVVFLDDDVVVQKDLTPLFSLDLHRNVIGAVETCLEAFHRFYKYLNFTNPLISSKFDPQACGWAFGVNVFDLAAWKKANVTGRYHYWQEQNSEQLLWKTGTLSPGLLAFYGLMEPLDRRWHVLGLGYDMDVDDRLIDSAAVVHFNGNMKPWQKLAISRYKHVWQQYINLSHPHLQECIMH